MMKKIYLEVSDELVQQLKPYEDKLTEIVLLGLQQLKIHEALMLYSRGLISFGRAAELAGLSERELIRHARAAGIQPQWNEDMLEDELA